MAAEEVQFVDEMAVAIIISIALASAEWQMALHCLNETYNKNAE